MKKEGTITNIDNGMVTIQICSESACSGCNAKLICGTAKKDSKTIECYTSDANNFNIGDNVTVQISDLTSYKAILMAYIVPIVILVGTLSLCTWSGISEGIASLTSLAMLAVYYGLLYSFKDAIKKRILFKIVKQ